MPDISLLVELSEFYQVSIPEIIDGERKSEKMNEEVRDTAVKMAEYSKNEVNIAKRKVRCSLLMVFGVIIMISALMVFPNESSWGSVYAVIGGMILITGIYLSIKTVLAKRLLRILSVVGCSLVLFGIFMVADYVAVSHFHEVPRFRYEVSYGGGEIEYKTLFYTVIRKNPGTKEETIEIVK